MFRATIVRDALRQLLSRPGASVLLIGILALGIGVNAAMFGLARTALLRPLPVAEPDTLVRLFTHYPEEDQISNGSYPWFRDIAALPVFERAAAYTEYAGLSAAPGHAPAERRNAGLASGAFFETLGVQAVLGRTFGKDDDRGLGQHPVVVLTDRYWRTRLNADANAIGSVLRINGEPFDVIGVLPPEFVAPSLGTRVDFWLPLAMTPQAQPGFIDRDFREAQDFSWLDVVARLAPGTTIEGAQSALDAWAQVQLAKHAVGTPWEGSGPQARVMDFRAASVDPYGTETQVRNAWLLMGVAALVLLIACANAAGLLLVRGQERTHELAVRAGLGAGVSRLAAQLMGEAMVLTTLGALVGFGVAHLLIRAVVALAPDGLLLPGDDGSLLLDPLVLGFGIACALLALLLAALLPSLRLARVDACAVLRGGDVRSTGDVRGQRWRGALVSAQLAATLVLLVTAALLLRTLWHTIRIDPGFVADNALVASVQLGAEAQQPERQRELLERIRTRVTQQPGVLSAAWMVSVPIWNGGMRSTLQTDMPGSTDDAASQTDMNIVSPGAFDTLGVPLLRGRDFDAGDDGRAPVVIVNRAFAEKFFPGVEPLGRRIVSIDRERGGAVIVGIVSDHKQRSLRDAAPPQVFLPLAQRPVTRVSLLVRTADDPVALAATIPRIVAGIDAEIPVFGIRTLADQLAMGYSEQRAFAWLLGGFGVLAALLAAAGLYGLLSGWLRSRTRELGIRLAVGASRERIAALVLRQGAWLLLLGAGGGVVLALVASRLLGNLLFGVAPHDVPTYFVAVLLLALVAAAAMWLPLRRALRVDPIVALRHD